jgi:hypothetical protein
MKANRVPRRTGLLALLCGMIVWGSLATAGAHPQRLDGSWAMTVVATSPPGLPPLTSLITFTRDGEVIESRRGYLPFSPFGPILETAGHGAWDRARHGAFDVTFTFLVQAAPDNTAFPNGDPLGTDTIHLRITVGDSGDSFSGIFVSEARAADGTVVFSASGTVQGARIKVERLP